MNYNNSIAMNLMRCAALIFLAAVIPSARATTFWTGPTITWTKSGATPSDTVLSNKVVLTRGGNQVLYNTAASELFAGIDSPKGTLWAFGDFTNHTTFQTMESMRDGFL